MHFICITLKFYRQMHILYTRAFLHLHSILSTYITYYEIRFSPYFISPFCILYIT